MRPDCLFQMVYLNPGVDVDFPFFPAVKVKPVSVEVDASILESRPTWNCRWFQTCIHWRHLYTIESNVFPSIATKQPTSGLLCGVYEARTL